MTSRKLRKIAESQSEGIYDIYSQERASGQLSKLIENLCQCLATRQAHAVDLVFFQGRSLEEAARHNHLLISAPRLQPDEQCICKSSLNDHARGLWWRRLHAVKILSSSTTSPFVTV